MTDHSIPIKTHSGPSRLAKTLKGLVYGAFLGFLLLGIFKQVDINVPMYLVVGILILIAVSIVSGILLLIQNDWALKKYYKITGELNLEQGLFDLKPGADAQIYVDAQDIRGEIHGWFVKDGCRNSITLVRDKRAISEITFILENRQQMAIVHDYFQEMNKSGYDIRFEPFVPIIPRFL